MLYFAYGSNMSSKRLLVRTPSAQFITVGKLYQHRLTFHKISHDGSAKCDAFATEQHVDFVLGVVFDIVEDEKPELDLAEGLGNGYEIKPVNIEAESGDRFEAFTYYATHIDHRLQPYHWYKQHVLAGAREHNLLHEYVTSITRVQSIDDPDRKRHEAEMLIYR